MNTPTDLEARITAALAARAEQVRPEHVSPALAPVVAMRRRTPLIVLAAAACILLAIGLTVWLPRHEDRVEPTPKPSETEIVIPPDVGRDWSPDDLSSPARLDLDGDGTKEKVEFLAEPAKDFTGRTRLQTTLSSTGEEAYGMAQLATTIGTSALDPIDADGDGDQELVLYLEDLEGGPGALRVPLVFDLRDGVLVQMQPIEPDEFVAGEVAVPGETTTYFELVHTYEYWIEDGSLFTSRSRSAFASGNMSLFRPENYVVDVFRWSLGDDGLLRPSDAGCRVLVPEGSSECGPDAADDLPGVTSEATETFGTGEQADFDTGGFIFSARLDAAADPSVVVEMPDGSELTAGLEVGDPLVNTTQTNLAMYDGPSLLVTSASDPSVLRVYTQDSDRPDQLRQLEPVGEIALGDHSWLTDNGALVTVVEEDDGSWQAWQWQWVGKGKMAALPWGSLCFDDVDDPTTGHRC